ncbi:MAG: (2Fe-2S)-binding protein [Alphaproteobacteria bacterium]
MTTRETSGQEIICGCFNLTRGALEKAAAGSNFEQFLEETRAGSRCTACLLDVEYLFVNAPKNPTAAGSRIVRQDQRSFKRRLYDILDRLAPQIPFRLTNTAPLLSGRGIVERLWLVNQPMVFGKKAGVPPHRFALTVRDGEGRVIGRERHDVSCGESKAIMFPGLPTQSSQELSVGSVEIVRWGLSPGVRGTTRPHFEVEAARSNTTLHVQGAAPNPEAWLTTIHRPVETRILFIAVNVASRPLVLEFDVGENSSVLTHVEIPPFGARVIEPMPKNVQPGQPLTYHYRGRGRGKVHVITASPTLDRLTLDHL